jgi:transcriptional regulator with XRE-family HTH domain
MEQVKAKGFSSVEATARIRMTLGEFIRQHLEKRGLSQTELASIAGLPLSVVNQILNDVTINPTILTLKALSKAWRPPRGSNGTYEYSQKDFWDFVTKRWRN